MQDTHVEGPFGVVQVAQLFVQSLHIWSLESPYLPVEHVKLQAELYK